MTHTPNGKFSEQKNGEKVLFLVSVVIAAMVLNYIGIAAVFVPLPFFILYHRYDERIVYPALAIFYLLTLAYNNLFFMPAFSWQRSAEIFLLSVPCVGILFMLLAKRFLAGLSFVWRFLAPMLLLEVIVLPVVIFSLTLPQVREFIDKFFQQITAIYANDDLNTAFGPTADLIDKELVYAIIARGFMVSYYIQLGISYFFSRAFAVKRGWLPAGKRLPDLTIPDYYIWYLIIAVCGLFITLFVDITFFAALCWNTFFLIALLYMIQGAAIISHKAAGNRQFGRRLYILIFLFVVLSLFWNGAFLLLLAAILFMPLLGIADTWLKFRNKQ